MIDDGTTAPDDGTDPEPPPRPVTPRRSGRDPGVLGAAMLGVGAILQPKADPEAHWSESPKVVLEIREEQHASGPALDLDPASVPDAPPAEPRPPAPSWLPRWLRRR